MKILRNALIFMVLLIIAVGCTDYVPQDRRLAAIDELSSIDGPTALDSLLMIDASSLSEADRHYYDFLRVKVVDKAYVRHTSDSLILSVIDYERHHKATGRYPEALYYGGRVYSDLGDKPTARRYMTDALNQLPDDASTMDLRSRINSQVGGLLDDLRLYEEAIRHYKISADLSRQLGDTVGEVYDLQSLGLVCLRSNKLKSADSCFRLALKVGCNLDSTHTAKTRMYIAGTKYKEGDMDSALYYIRNTLNKVKPLVRNSVLAYGSEIYMKNGICDTAFIYARSLIKSSEEDNRKTGYAVLFSDSIRKFVPADSLAEYAVGYHRELERAYNEHESKLEIMQQALYNYEFQERLRRDAERRNTLLIYIVGGFCILSLALACLILVNKNRSKNEIIRLKTELENLSKLEQKLNAEKSVDEATDKTAEGVVADKCRNKDMPECEPNAADTSDGLKQEDSSEEDSSDMQVDSKESVGNLRKRKREKLLSIYYSAKTTYSLPAKIMLSEPYKQLQNYIEEKKTIGESDKIWSSLEEVVLVCSPDFKINLQLLLGGKLGSYDLHTALLIKCGMTPEQMSILFNRTKGAISSRRGDMCQRIFDEKLGNKVVDGIICLL